MNDKLLIVVAFVACINQVQSNILNYSSFFKCEHQLKCSHPLLTCT